MATVSINVPDELVPRLTAAARAMYPQHEALGPVALFKTITAAQWRNLLISHERSAGETAAATKASVDAVGIS